LKLLHKKIGNGIFNTAKLLDVIRKNKYFLAYVFYLAIAGKRRRRGVILFQLRKGSEAIDELYYTSLGNYVFFTINTDYQFRVKYLRKPHLKPILLEINYHLGDI